MAPSVHPSQRHVERSRSAAKRNSDGVETSLPQNKCHGSDSRSTRNGSRHGLALDYTNSKRPWGLPTAKLLTILLAFVDCRIRMVIAPVEPIVFQSGNTFETLALGCS